jgi:putative transposase
MAESLPGSGCGIGAHLEQAWLEIRAQPHSGISRRSDSGGYRKLLPHASTPTAQKAGIEVLHLCAQRHIDSPSASAIRARLAHISKRDRLRGRGYRERARNKFQPVPGAFPGADYPLSVVQIDHTPVDIILVNDEYRKSINRPWLTLAIDVCTRMLVGYYLSFDAPSETSVAMCVAHAILPKEEWLLLHKVDADWPVWGRPHKIHVDNGSDFRSSSFRQS